ncbi:MAG: DNA-protecting protein DprA [Solobacterium sp.]|nr:DNA-protecting protein DprA [Solobacterium sp.]
MNAREKLAAWSWMSAGNWYRTAECMKKNLHPDIHVRVPYLTLLDDAYPARLRELRWPPWVLYYRGDPALLQRHAVSIIGSRNASQYGMAMVQHIVGTIGRDTVYVSGLAKGIDSEVHRSAIGAGAYTIGVIGSGLDTVYPQSSADLYRVMGNDHLILSEYPPYVGVRKQHFPWRNRIIAALGDQLIVAQAALKSGTMHTVNEAIALSRDIYCVPYPFGSVEGKGCSLLISQGAQILYDDEQLILLANSAAHTLS